MKSTIFTIIKKELTRFFGDKRLAFVTILLPGLLIYVVYSLMGGFIASAFTPSGDYEYQVAAVNLPQAIEREFSAVGITCEAISQEDVENIKAEIKNEKYDALIVFPEDFSESIENKTSVPNVEIYYNAAKTESASAYDILSGALNAYESRITNLFDVNAGDDNYNLAGDKELLGMIISTILPMLLMIMLLTGALSVTPESIAGEKERGTIAALLVTPAKRSSIAIGKIISLSVIALLSGLSSTLGVLLSIPKLISGIQLPSGGAYNFGDYALLLLVILSTVLLLVAVLSIISAFAKTVKEATSWSSPVMFIIMGLSLTTMIPGLSASPLMCVIPLFNSVQCMSAIFSFSINPINFVVTVISNVAFTALCVWVLTKMFDSERVVFSK